MYAFIKASGEEKNGMKELILVNENSEETKFYCEDTDKFKRMIKDVTMFLPTYKLHITLLKLSGESLMEYNNNVPAGFSLDKIMGVLESICYNANTELIGTLEDKMPERDIDVVFYVKNK